MTHRPNPTMPYGQQGLWLQPTLAELRRMGENLHELLHVTLPPEEYDAEDVRLASARAALLALQAALAAARRNLLPVE